MALQSAIWARKAQWMQTQCRARFGETFTLRIVHEGTWIMLSNPDHVRQVFTGDPRIFHAGEGNRVLLPILGEHSVLLLDDGNHLEQRRLLLPPFHGKRMQSYKELMERVARDEINRWPRDEPTACDPGCRRSRSRSSSAPSSGWRRVSGSNVYVERCGGCLICSRPGALVLPVLMGPDRLSRSRAFQRLLATIDCPIYEQIEERRRAPDLDQRSDILSLLLAARREDGQPMGDQELRDELVTLLVAGHETTATALAWAVERLAHHPDKLERLTEEVRAGESKYLDAVVTRRCGCGPS